MLDGVALCLLVALVGTRPTFMSWEQRIPLVLLSCAVPPLLTPILCRRWRTELVADAVGVRLLRPWAARHLTLNWGEVERLQVYPGGLSIVEVGGAQHWLRIPAVEAAQIHEVAGWLEARGGTREPGPAEVPASLDRVTSRTEGATRGGRRSGGSVFRKRTLDMKA
jgi:hypothetical protein